VQAPAAAVLCRVYGISESTTPYGRGSLKPLISYQAGNEPRPEEAVDRTFSPRLGQLSDPAAGEMPAYGVYTRVRVADGKLQEFQDLLKTEILPIYKKANAPYTVTRRALGANNNDVTQVVWLGKAADLDAGPLTLRTLGQAGLAKYLAKAGSMATLVEQVVRRRVPELSY